MSDRPDRTVPSGGTVRIDDLPGPDTLFVQSYVPVSHDDTTVRRLPRSWVEVEKMVEDRLSQFSDRHLRECNQQFERGVQEGIRQSASTMAAASGPIDSIVERLDGEIIQYWDQLYAQAATLASAIASQWFVDLVSINPHVFLSAMHDALEPLRHLDKITIRINPEDYETLKSGLNKGDIACLEFGSVDVVPDPAVQRGGAISTSEGGSVDARLKTRIRRTMELLRIEAREF